MNNWAGDILNTIEDAIKAKNYRGLKICTVKTVQPLVFTCEGIEIGTSKGDSVYVHPLFVSPLIAQDEALLGDSQMFKSTTAYNSPEFEGIMEGSIPDFLKEFYLFYKNWQSVYLLNEGDLIAVFEFGDADYLILQKLAKDELKEEIETDKKEENN